MKSYDRNVGVNFPRAVLEGEAGAEDRADDDGVDDEDDDTAGRVEPIVRGT